MDSQRSAAGRLLRIVKNAVDQPSGVLVYVAWANAFSIPPEERALVFQAIAGIHRLIDEAKAEVAAHPELNQTIYLGALTNIERAVTSAQLQSQWAQYVGQFQGSNAIALEFVAEQFDRLLGEIVIPEDVLTTLRERIEAITAEILASDITAELRTILVSKLEDARRAVLFYQLDGAEGLRTAAESAIGAVVLAREAAGAESKKKPFLDYIKLINEILDVVSKAKPYLALVKPVVKALLSSGV